MKGNLLNGITDKRVTNNGIQRPARLRTRLNGVVAISPDHASARALGHHR